MGSDSGQPPLKYGSVEFDQARKAALERLENAKIAVYGAIPEIVSTNSDRACVLVAVSLIDNALEVLLRTMFLISSEATQKECDFLLIKRPVPPLGSASIRARLAFALGLIDRESLNAISYAIEKRNEYAHKLTPPPLTDEVVANLHGLFSTEHQKRMEDIEDRVRKKMAAKSADQAAVFAPKPRENFARMCSDMCIELYEKSMIIEMEKVKANHLDKLFPTIPERANLPNESPPTP